MCNFVLLSDSSIDGSRLRDCGASRPMNSKMQLERMEARGIHNLLEDDIPTDLILSLLSSVHGMHRTRLEERGLQRACP